MKAKAFAGLVRLWSLPLSAVLVLLGGAIAYRFGPRFSLTGVVVATLAALLLQAGANSLNDVNDVLLGVDRPGVATAVYRRHPILEGEVSKRGAVLISACLISAGAGLGVYVATVSGPLVLVLGAIGIVLLLSYNGPLLRLKMVGAGEITVATVFGPLLLLGGFAAASGAITLTPILVSAIPFALMFATIYSNFYRDRESDSRAEIRSLALLTQAHALELYSGLIASAYLVQAAYVALGAMPPTSLVTFLTIPYALKLPSAFKGKVPDLDARTGRLFIMYNALLALGLLL